MLSGIKKPAESEEGKDEGACSAKHTTSALHRITCEMKITKTWQEAGELEGIREESSYEESEELDPPALNDSPKQSPILHKQGSKPTEPIEITKQKSSKNRGATGHKKSEDSVGFS
jgi:hypothetical protein